MATIRFTREGDLAYTERRDLDAVDAYTLASDLFREANPTMCDSGVGSRTLSAANSGGMWDEGTVLIRISVTDDELDAMDDFFTQKYPRGGGE